MMKMKTFTAQEKIIKKKKNHPFKFGGSSRFDP